jgi:hypothetical protein
MWLPNALLKPLAASFAARPTAQAHDWWRLWCTSPLTPDQHELDVGSHCCPFLLHSQWHGMCQCCSPNHLHTMAHPLSTNEPCRSGGQACRQVGVHGRSGVPVALRLPACHRSFWTR